MQLNKLNTVFSSDDIYYDMIDGGYFHPEDYFDYDSCRQIKEAIATLNEAVWLLEEAERIEYR